VYSVADGRAVRSAKYAEIHKLLATLKAQYRQIYMLKLIPVASTYLRRCRAVESDVKRADGGNQSQGCCKAASIDSNRAGRRDV